LDMARTSHSATLLNNGTVFVAGGQGDPSSWEILTINGMTLSSGTLLNGFYSHLAVRLANGNVFLAGGLPSPGAWEIHSPSGVLLGDGSLTGKRTPGAGIVVLQNGNIWISGSGASFKSDECTWEILDINGKPVSNGVLNTCFASGKVFLLSNGDVLLIGGFNAPNTYEIRTQSGAFFKTGNIVNGFDNSAGATQLGNSVFLFESGFCEYVGFDTNANMTFDTSCTLLDSRLGSKGVLTSTGEFFITGGSAAGGTWEMWKPSGSTVTRVGNGNLFDDRNIGHSDTHF
jgi:galactose oxidase-like protein